MKKYYLHNGNEQEGPFDIDELKAKNITPDTPIWYDGIENWTSARDIDELKECFSGKTPPPFKPKVETNQTDSHPISTNGKKIGKEVIIAVVVIGILSLLVFAINKNHSGEGSLYESSLQDTFAEVSNVETTTPQTYEQKVQTVGEIEQSQPTKFLSSTGTYRVAMFKKIKILGSITNSATVATYKDLVIKVTYYSKSNTVLHEKEFTVYDLFPPNSTKNFEWRVNNYVDVNTIGWNVISATAAN